MKALRLALMVAAVVSVVLSMALPWPLWPYAAAFGMGVCVVGYFLS
jgi:hypothetical protein